MICEGDCLKILPTLEAESFDLIIADPPYGNVINEEWDKIPNYYEFSLSWLTEAKKLLKPTGSIYVWCSIGPKSSSLLDIATILKKDFCFQDMIVWAKQRGRGNRQGWLFTREELLWATKSNNYTWNKSYSSEKYDPLWVKRLSQAANKKNKPFSPYKRNTNVWKDIPEITIQKVKLTGSKGSRHSYHPNQKPIVALERIVVAHTKEGDAVLDLFAGSGSTSVACELTQRKWTAIEKDPNYCKIIAERICDARKTRNPPGL